MTKIIEHPALRELTKVSFDLGADAWHGYSRESVWAKPSHGRGYELRNTPFFAVGFAYGDVVSVRRSDALLQVEGVVSRSGHSTYRVLVDNNEHALAEPQLAELTRLGCSYESLRDVGWVLYAFDVPEGRAREAYGVLQRGLESGIWDFDEGLFAESDTGSGSKG